MTLLHESRRDRELTVCQMIANGMTRKEVAGKINRTRSLIDKIVADLMAKHKTSTEAGLIAKLIREGLLK